MPALFTGFNQPFGAQVEFLRNKLDLPTSTWRDIWQSQHDRSFVVAGAMKADLLADLHGAVLTAAEQGTGLEAFRKDFAAIVERNGWHGWTGEGSKAGEAWRTKVIFQTNMATSYAAGRLAQINDPDLAKSRPYIQYHHADGVMHPRPQHLAWNGLVLPKGHPFWTTHAPPNGWGCHCYLSAAGAAEHAQAQSDGKATPPVDWDTINEKTGAPPGIDKGWAYNPGASRMDELQQFAADKAGRLKGIAPRAIFNRVLSDLTPSEILRMTGIDEQLLADVGAVKAVEYYVRAVRPGILADIAEGGIPGSAALKHELVETSALAKAGVDIYDPGDVRKIVGAFDRSLATGDPVAHIPWHLEALKAELEYAQARLRTKGIEVTLGEAARAVYGAQRGEARQKIQEELAHIGAKWQDSVREEVLRALHG